MADLNEKIMLSPQKKTNAFMCIINSWINIKSPFKNTLRNKTDWSRHTWSPKKLGSSGYDMTTDGERWENKCHFELEKSSMWVSDVKNKFKIEQIKVQCEPQWKLQWDYRQPVDLLERKLSHILPEKFPLIPILTLRNKQSSSCVTKLCFPKMILVLNILTSQFLEKPERRRTTLTATDHTL